MLLKVCKPAMKGALNRVLSTPILQNASNHRVISDSDTWTALCVVHDISPPKVPAPDPL